MTPKTMRGVLLRGHGGLEQLQFRDDLPVPAPAPGEVLIEIGAAGVNNTDINMRTGWYSKVAGRETESRGQAVVSRARDAAWTGAAVSFPRIQGADACGRIVAVGVRVEAARIGERVLVNPVLASLGRTGDAVCYFGSDRDGAFAQFAAVPAANACQVTSALSDAELASFPCAYSTAENLLTRAGVRADEMVLITGASGGVGSAVVQLAKRRGAHVIAIASEKKAVAVKSLGANQVLSRDANLATELGSEAVDVVIDVVGGPQFSSLLEVLRRAGRYAVAGAIAGPHVDLDLRTLYLKDLRLIGCTNLEPQVFANLIACIERGELKPVVSAVYPLSEIAAAQTAFLSRAHVGKVVLVP